MSFTSHPPNFRPPEAMEPADFDFDPLRPTTIELSADDIDWAARISQSVADVDQQWQSYIRALALKGFHQWLAAGATHLQPVYDTNSVLAAGITCGVGDFRLCLVPQESLADDRVHIPVSSVEAADCAHLYILIEVLEEAEQVTVLNSLRRDRLLTYLQTTQLVSHADGTYAVPTSAFDTQPDTLLLFLNHLAVAQLTPSSTTIAEPRTADAPSARSPLPSNPESSINVGAWLQDRLDAVANSLAWTLMAPLAPAHQMMSVSTPEEMLETILPEIASANLDIPSHARGAYTDLERVDLPLRLYALTWPLLNHDQPEWSLLLCLGSITGDPLPVGTRLVIRDANQVLAAPMQQVDEAASYLYAQVIGEWHEAFTVKVEMPNGVAYHWPPFVFQPAG